MTQSRQHAERTRGFTLIEVLIAVAAFAIVLAAINTVFYSALRLRNKTARILDESLPVQQTLTIMKRDLANIVVPGGTLSGAFQTTPTLSLNNQTGNSTPSSSATASVPGQSSPPFYTSTGVIDEITPFAEVQRVSYLLVNPTNGVTGRDLFRSVTRNLLAPVAEQPVMQPLMSRVENIYFSYYDGTQWRDTWDSTSPEVTTGQTNMLPTAIKVQIQLAAEQRRQALPPPIELVVPIMVQVRTNQVAGGGQ
jgi:prepilin-type N-terminal cleavage/methylation domain-containing protein